LKTDRQQLYNAFAKISRKIFAKTFLNFGQARKIDFAPQICDNIPAVKKF